MKEKNLIYVDKTEYVAQLIRGKGPFFLSRPRRFGKSTLVSTFETLFEQGLDAFEGLKIAQYSKEQLKLDRLYKVLHISFATYKEEQQNQTIEDYYIQEIRDFFESLGIYIDSKYITLSSVFKAGLNQLKEDIVLLIDEYDAPLVSCLDDETKFTELRKVFSNFYQVVKKYDAKFRFIFLTGVTRFSHVSIFSAFNNLQDISFKSEYGGITGYTQEELESYFGEYIENASNVLNAKYKTDKYTANYIIEQLKLNYDGYSFDKQVSCHVYNPWSILNFFQSPGEEFDSYWVDSGSAYPALLRDYIQKLVNKKKVLEGLDLNSLISSSSASLSPNLSSSPNTIEELCAILYQAGYYSIKSSTKMALKIGIPNLEVKAQFAHIIFSLLAKQSTNIDNLHTQFDETLLQALEERDFDTVKSSITTLYNELSYETVKKCTETSFRDILKIAFVLFGINVQTEVHSALGRADIVITTDTTMFIIELKVATTTNEVQAKAREAKAQILERKYADRVTDLEIVPLVMVILNKAKSTDKKTLDEQSTNTDNIVEQDNSKAMLEVAVLERV